jgi:outer membrane protein assembly factor BamE
MSANAFHSARLGDPAARCQPGCLWQLRRRARIASVVTPYKVDVVQGNFISREQVEALQAGMGRQQVRDILGTPLITSLFHADRWDMFSLQRPGQPYSRAS